MYGTEQLVRHSGIRRRYGHLRCRLRSGKSGSRDRSHRHRRVYRFEQLVRNNSRRYRSDLRYRSVSLWNRCGRRWSVHRNRKRVGHTVLQWRILDYAGSEHALYRVEHGCGIHLHLWKLDLGHLDSGCGRRVFSAGQHLRIVLLQRRDMDHTRNGFGVFRDQYRSRVHLHQWQLVIRKRNRGRRRVLRRRWKRSRRFVLQWLVMGHARDKHGMHWNGDRGRLCLHQQPLGQRNTKFGRGLLNRGKRVRFSILQWHGVGHARGEHGVHWNGDRGRLYLHQQPLGQRNAEFGRGLLNRGKRVRFSILQWHDVGHARAEHGVHWNSDRGDFYLHQQPLGR
jgi:hypothetical protein